MYTVYVLSELNAAIIVAKSSFPPDREYQAPHVRTNGKFRNNVHVPAYQPSPWRTNQTYFPFSPGFLHYPASGRAK